MTLLECSQCHGTHFRIHTPPEHTEMGNRFIYVVCDGCQKLLRIIVNVISVHEGIAEKFEVEIAE